MGKVEGRLGRMWALRDEGGFTVKLGMMARRQRMDPDFYIWIHVLASGHPPST